MDLSALTYDVDQPFDFAVPDPKTGKATDFVLSLLSIDSEAVRSANLRLQNQLIAKQALMGKRSRSQTANITAEDMEEAKLETVLAAITGWRGLKDKGQEVAYSPLAARKLFSSPALRRLVDEIADAVGDPQDFLPRPSAGTAS